MVIDGRRNVVGTNRPEVTRAIEEATAAAPIVDVTLDDAGGGRARLTAGTAPAEAATVWLITFDDDHDTTIARGERSEEHTSELQSLMRISYAVFCLKKKQYNNISHTLCIRT